MSRGVTVLSHQRPDQVAPAVDRLVSAARAAGVELRFDQEEAAKLGVLPEAGVIAVGAHPTQDVSLCVALGGDGTILRALRRYAGTGVPVFAVNFGEVGFLATVEPEDVEQGAFEQAFSGEFDHLALPAIAIEVGDGVQVAINDVSIQRRIGERVATLAYGLGGEEVGSVRCDGLVVCTPAGSTGYNLANGGPVLAWGVEGYGVSFIAPHSFNARALVVAPHDVLHVHNRSEEPVDISIDGRPAGHIDPHEEVHARFLREATVLAQLQGTSFYRRLREKFGRLSS
ncbi:MAG: NAD(+)/NADH kinase [Solirubrobacteraceae bacterium]|nr:NAD(+)/NADH kinase [Solirubrobacteraceae bacterium]